MLHLKPPPQNENNFDPIPVCVFRGSARGLMNQHNFQTGKEDETWSPAEKYFL